MVVERAQLLEQGFEYVTEFEGVKLFRKPKTLFFYVHAKAKKYDLYKVLSNKCWEKTQV